MKKFSNEINGSRKKVNFKAILKYCFHIFQIILFVFVLNILGSFFIYLLGLISPDLVPTDKSFPIILNISYNILYGFMSFLFLIVIGLTVYCIGSVIKDEICKSKKEKSLSKTKKHKQKK